MSVTETEPAGKNYQVWMLSQLDALSAALAAGDTGAPAAASAAAK
jgi:zinc/manganese transport system substrate-binding protein